jgi:FkbM family methyltransferase
MTTLASAPGPATAKRVDPGAIGSDKPRSWAQYWARLAGEGLVRLLGLNGPGLLQTEIAQAIKPVVTIPTRHGPLLCRGGHGRLVWRARTFFIEEPQTVEWLDGLGPEDVLWDVGANVGLFSLYAAKFRGCEVVAFEPESQNYALLLENIALNGAGQRCLPACVALAERSGFGLLKVPYITKSGAYNLFVGRDADGGQVPESIRAARQAAADEVREVRQLVCGFSLDALVYEHGFRPPTHLKIDVDGIEPDIVAGASTLLRDRALRGVLVEINRRSARDLAIPEVLAREGFRKVSERSNWLSRDDRSREQEAPTVNMIFSRAAGG